MQRPAIRLLDDRNPPTWLIGAVSRAMYDPRTPWKALEAIGVTNCADGYMDKLRDRTISRLLIHAR